MATVYFILVQSILSLKYWLTTERLHEIRRGSAPFKNQEREWAIQLFE